MQTCTMCGMRAPAAGPAEQLGTKVGRFLMRVRITGAPDLTGGTGGTGGAGGTRETAYFKAVPGMYAREGGVLRVLNRLADGAHSAHVPELLACDEERHWVLTRGREGTRLPNIEDLDTWEAALHAFAHLQIACVAHAAELLAAGGTDLPV